MLPPLTLPQIVECSIKIELVKDNWTELKGEIAGPPDTPYAGGKFELEIKVPETYPFNPPKVRFITKIWHPNISSVTGAICLDILKENWAAAMTLRTVLLSLQALLSAAEPDDPQDAVVATQYKENYEMFKVTARNWTTAYANGNHYIGDKRHGVTPSFVLFRTPTIARARGKGETIDGHGSEGQ